MSLLTGKKILIVGGNGYVGNRIAARLVQHSATVSIFSRTGPRFHYPQNRNINWINGDIMNASSFKEQINEHDTIVHTVATLFDTSITKFRQPGDIGTYEHMNRDTFLALLKTLESPKQVIYISAEGHPPFIPRYEITKKQSQQALLNSEHDGYILRPGFIYDATLKKWSIPLRHLIRLWNKVYPYVPLNNKNSTLGKIWAEFKQSQPTSLNKIAESIVFLCQNKYENRIIEDQQIRELSDKYVLQKEEKK